MLIAFLGATWLVVCSALYGRPVTAVRMALAPLCDQDKGNLLDICMSQGLFMTSLTHRYCYTPAADGTTAGRCIQPFVMLSLTGATETTALLPV